MSTYRFFYTTLEVGVSIHKAKWGATSSLVNTTGPTTHKKQGHAQIKVFPRQ